MEREVAVYRTRDSLKNLHVR